MSQSINNIFNDLTQPLLKIRFIKAIGDLNPQHSSRKSSLIHHNKKGKILYYPLSPRKQKSILDILISTID